MLTTKALIMIATSTTALVGGGVAAIVYSFSGVVKTAEDWNREIKTQQESISATETKLKSAKTAKATLESERDTAVKKITTLTTEIAGYDSTIDSKTPELSVLTAKATTATSTLNAAKTTATAALAEWTKTSNTLSTATTAKTNAESALSEKTIEITTLAEGTAELEAATIQLATFKAEKQNTADAYDLAVAANEQATTKKVDADKLVAAAQTEADTATDAKLAADKVIEEVQANKTAATDKKTAQETIKNQKDSAIAATEGEIKTLEPKITQLKTQLKASQDSLDRLKKESSQPTT